jgi:hypothetical protein
MIIVGTVVNLREKLAWYKTKSGLMHAVYASEDAKGWLPQK